MKYSAYGMNDAQVLNCLNRYDFGSLTEIISSIDFKKGQFTFTFKTPTGFKSWKQWLYLNDQYKALNDLLRALNKADDMDTGRTFYDQNDEPFADVDGWNVTYSKR